MCSHVPPLFLLAVFVPCGTLSAGISLTLPVVSRNTGGGVSALAAVILDVHNTEGEQGQIEGWAWWRYSLNKVFNSQNNTVSSQLMQ